MNNINNYKTGYELPKFSDTSLNKNVSEMFEIENNINGKKIKWNKNFPHDKFIEAISFEIFLRKYNLETNCIIPFVYDKVLDKDSKEGIKNFFKVENYDLNLNLITNNKFEENINDDTGNFYLRITFKHWNNIHKKNYINKNNLTNESISIKEEKVFLDEINKVIYDKNGNKISSENNIYSYTNKNPNDTNTYFIIKFRTFKNVSDDTSSKLNNAKIFGNINESKEYIRGYRDSKSFNKINQDNYIEIKEMFTNHLNLIFENIFESKECIEEDKNYWKKNYDIISNKLKYFNKYEDDLFDISSIKNECQIEFGEGNSDIIEEICEETEWEFECFCSAIELFNKIEEEENIFYMIPDEEKKLFHIIFKDGFEIKISYYNDENYDDKTISLYELNYDLNKAFDKFKIMKENFLEKKYEM